MRAKLLAITSGMPAPLMAIGACSREEPQPKFSLATRMSPGCTFLGKSGSASSMTWAANSSAVFMFR